MPTVNEPWRIGDVISYLPSDDTLSIADASSLDDIRWCVGVALEKVPVGTVLICRNDGNYYHYLDGRMVIAKNTASKIEDKTMRHDDGRYMVATLSRQIIVDVLRGRAALELDWPDDAAIEDVRDNMLARGFDLLIHSMAFEPIAPGTEVPRLPPIRVRRRDNA